MRNKGENKKENKQNRFNRHHITKIGGEMIDWLNVSKKMGTKNPDSPFRKSGHLIFQSIIFYVRRNGC